VGTSRCDFPVAERGVGVQALAGAGNKLKLELQRLRLPAPRSANLPIDKLETLTGPMRRSALRVNSTPNCVNLTLF
jgi:hypothetical protein